MDPTLLLGGAAPVLSYYDTAPLKSTLERLVDFDRINHGEVRLSVGAVDVRSGNSVYFDSKHHRIGIEYFMASGALPPGFPPVHIDGEDYWDGGILSNTPLQYVLDSFPRTRRLVVLQVDLFSARGPMPRMLSEVVERQKEITYSSRTPSAATYHSPRSRSRPPCIPWRRRSVPMADCCPGDRSGCRLP